MSDKEDVDWVRIERLIRDSILGLTLPEHSIREFERAWNSDPDRYKSIHTQIKKEETDRLRSM